MKSPVLELRNVTCAFGDRSGHRREVLHEVSVSVAGREFVGMIGPTGCGKTTLLNVAAGLLAPASGQVLADGTLLRGRNERAGYMFQSDALLPWNTALDNIAVGLRFGGMAVAPARAAARQWLDRVGLAGFGGHFPHQLSGGMRKRVALAQVLARDPPLLLMDEPFSALDAQTRVLMGDALLALWQAERKSVLFVTHDLEEAIALSDRVLVLSAGPASRVIAEFVIALPRPREVAEIRLTPAFQAIHREVWDCLRTEVLRATSTVQG